MIDLLPVRLHVYPPLFGVQAVRFEGAGLAESLDLIHHLVAAVVPSSWQSLGVLRTTTVEKTRRVGMGATCSA